MAMTQEMMVETFKHLHATQMAASENLTKQHTEAMQMNQQAAAAAADAAGKAIVESMRTMMDEFSKSLPQMQPQQAQPQTQPQKKEHTYSQRLDMRNFLKVEKLTGGENQWADWSSDLRILVESVNPDLEKYFKAAEESTETLEPKSLTMLNFYNELGGEGDTEGHARSKELYAIIRAHVEGEPES